MENNGKPLKILYFHGYLGLLGPETAVKTCRGAARAEDCCNFRFARSSWLVAASSRAFTFLTSCGRRSARKPAENTTAPPKTPPKPIENHPKQPKFLQKPIENHVRPPEILPKP